MTLPTVSEGLVDLTLDARRGADLAPPRTSSRAQLEAQRRPFLPPPDPRASPSLTRRGDARPWRCRPCAFAPSSPPMPRRRRLRDLVGCVPHSDRLRHRHRPGPGPLPFGPAYRRRHLRPGRPGMPLRQRLSRRPHHRPLRWLPLGRLRPPGMRRSPMPRVGASEAAELCARRHELRQQLLLRRGDLGLGLQLHGSLPVSLSAPWSFPPLRAQTSGDGSRAALKGGRAAEDEDAERPAQGAIALHLGVVRAEDAEWSAIRSTPLT